MNETAKRRVLELYDEVDRKVAAAGPVCVASGKCCRFKEYGHVLFVSQVEADILVESSDPIDTPVSEEACPYQKNGLCTARAPRPLGCRIYFCDPAYQTTAYQITEDALKALKTICAEEGIDWRYAPLHRFLSEPSSGD